MQRAVQFLRMFIRIVGVTLLILGLIIWSGNGAALVAPHAALGMVFVVALWVLAAIGAVAGIKTATVIRAIAWGIVALLFGMLQSRMMVGEMHWVIRGLHLLVGLVTIGVAEAVAAAIRQRLAARESARTTDPLARTKASV